MAAPRKRIAIVGAGVSGLVTAHLLHNDHDVAVFEAQDRPGGHAWTVDVELPSGTIAIDVGFLVFNDRNYPHFEALLADLGVESRASDMSFSVSDGADFEYAGNGPRGLFANPKHLYDPRFLKMVAEYVRFNKDARKLMDGTDDPSLRDWLAGLGYSDYFVHRLIVPQASAVWSADPEQMWSFPARFLVQFFDNHGLLGFRDRPEWRTVVGGSRRYVEAIIGRLGNERVRLGAEVTAVSREADGVTVTTPGGEPEPFDEVVLATHSDQALALLTDPSDLERERLGAIPYLPSELVLHTDTSLLPRRRAAWASWNAHYLEAHTGTPAVSYWLNNLQGHEIDRELIATLNLTERIDPAKVIATFDVAHPTYTPDGLETQRRHGEISGVNRTHYAGAYWSWGFHEDGVKSGHRVAEAILAAEPDRAIA